MSVRAYKIAEELGIERNEFVEKAKTLGIELRNAMATLDEEQIALLREKLSVKKTSGVTEARVERKGGSAVIRRRKRLAEPETVPVAVASPEPGVLATEPDAEVVAPASTAPVAEPEPEPELLRPAAAAPGPAATDAPREAAARARPPARDDALAERAESEAVQGGRESPRAGAARPSGDGPDGRAAYRDRPARLRLAAPQAPRRAARSPSGGGRRQARQARGARRGHASAWPSSPVSSARRPPQVQGKLMAFGTMVSIHQTIDVETAGRVAKEFGFEVQDVGFQEESFLDGARCRGGGSHDGQATRGRHRDGPRRSRQDVAARRDPRDQRGRRARPAASRSTSVPTRSPRTITRSPSSTRPATRPSRRCARVARRSPTW